MNYTKEDAEAAVKHAAELCDRLNPNWFKEIDLFTLEMSSCKRCILGQLFGHYIHGVYLIHRELKLEADDVYYGFNIPHEVDTKEERFVAYEILTAMWVKLISERYN